MSLFKEYLSDLPEFKKQTCLGCQLPKPDNSMPDNLTEEPRRFGKYYCPIARLGNKLGRRPSVLNLNNAQINKEEIPENCSQGFNETTAV